MSALSGLRLDRIDPDRYGVLMTIIAACRDQDGSIWMGCDLVSVLRGQRVRAGDGSKVFRLGEMLIGSSGSLRGSQVVQYLLPQLVIPVERDPREWLVCEFTQVFRDAVKKFRRRGRTELTSTC